MCVDVHAHHLPPSYVQLLRDADGPVFSGAHAEGTLQKMVEGQDDAGIACQIICTGPASPYLRDASLATAAAREVNDIYKDIVDRYDGRFAAFGSVPLPHGQAAAREAVRCLDELDFVGIHFGCSALGHPLDDPAFADMWSELDQREAIIYIHPGGILCGSEPGLAGMDDPGIAVTVGSAAELATTALRLVRLCRTHRRLRVIIGLLGGSLPFIIQRVSWLGARFKGKSILAEEGPDGSLIEELRRFYYDTNLLPDPAVIASARQAYGLDRLLFGSDAPALAPQETLRLMRDGGLSETEITRVLRDNPARLFGDRVPLHRALSHAH